MRIDLDAKVRTRDGEDAGSIKAAVLDPQSNEVTNFVVSTGGLFGRDVLVPRYDVESADKDGDTLRLALTKDELKQLSEYVPADYVPPPDGVPMPMGYGVGASSVLWPADHRFPAFTPRPPSYDPRRDAPPPGEMRPDGPIGNPESVTTLDSVHLDKGDAVLDSDGDDIGVVDDMVMDRESGRLQGFVLRVGGTFRTLFGGGDTVQVSASQVDHVQNGRVRLRVGKRDLQKAA